MLKTLSPAELESPKGPDEPEPEQTTDTDLTAASHERLSARPRVIAARVRLAGRHHQRQAELQYEETLAFNLPEAERDQLTAEAEQHGRASQICHQLGEYLDYRQAEELLSDDEAGNEDNAPTQTSIYDDDGSLIALRTNHDNQYNSQVDLIYSAGALELIYQPQQQFVEIEATRSNLIEQAINSYRQTTDLELDIEAEWRQDLGAHYEKVAQNEWQEFWHRLQELQEAHNKLDESLGHKVLASRQALEFLAKPDIDIGLDGIADHFATLLDIHACVQNRDGDNRRGQELQQLAEDTRQLAETFANPEQDCDQAGRQLFDAVWNYQVSGHRQLIPQEDQRAVAEAVDNTDSNMERVAKFSNYWMLLLKARMDNLYEIGVDRSSFNVDVPNKELDNSEQRARELRQRISHVESLRDYIRQPDVSDRERLARFTLAMLTEFTDDVHACISIDGAIGPHECSSCSASYDVAGNVTYNLPHPTKPDSVLSLV